MTNDFLPFGGGATANVIDQATYAALADRLSGFQSGVAKSEQLNKVWRQSSIMAAVLAQFIVDLTGQDAIDDGTIDALLVNLKAATAGRLLNLQVFTSSGTYTPTPGTASIIVEAVGGGGGGGGCEAPALGQGAVGGAGTSATYGKSRFTSGFYGGVSVTIGAGGKGGAAGANNGLNGGSTRFGTLLAVAGGAGGARGPSVVPPIFSGANANQSPLSPGGNILQMFGNVPIGSMLLSSTVGTCASGGNSPLGMGGGAHGLASAGGSGTGYGSGGSGAISYSGGIAYAGGNGAPGVAIISEYA